MFKFSSTRLRNGPLTEKFEQTSKQLFCNLYVYFWIRVLKLYIYVHTFDILESATMKKASLKNVFKGVTLKKITFPFKKIFVESLVLFFMVASLRWFFREITPIWVSWVYRRQKPRNCLSVFKRFVGLALRGLNTGRFPRFLNSSHTHSVQIPCIWMREEKSKMRIVLVSYKRILKIHKFSKWKVQFLRAFFRKRIQKNLAWILDALEVWTFLTKVITFIHGYLPLISYSIIWSFSIIFFPGRFMKLPIFKEK